MNAYYFGELDVAGDNEGDIYDCRYRGFKLLEQKKFPFKFSVSRELWRILDIAKNAAPLSLA